MASFSCVVPCMVVAGYELLWRAMYGCGGQYILVEVYVELQRACIAVEGYVWVWRSM